jgi:hypothetical protein
VEIAAYTQTIDVPAVTRRSGEHSESSSSQQQQQQQQMMVEQVPAIVATDSQEASSLYFNDTRAHLPPPRLELLHIPKTAGTVLEVAAADAGVVWGACHFEFTWKRMYGNPLRGCPPLDKTMIPKGSHIMWHVPIQKLLGRFNLSYNPYDNLVDKELAARPIKFFAVVRNPYDRLISSFIMLQSFKEKGKCNVSPESLNNVTREWLDRMATDYCHTNCFFIPQHEYIQDGSKIVVEHVLRFENLKQEFSDLTQQYGLEDVKLPEKHVNGRRCSARGLNVRDFKPELLERINRLYAGDFKHFGYTMVPPSPSFVGNTGTVGDILVESHKARGETIIVGMQIQRDRSEVVPTS